MQKKFYIHSAKKNIHIDEKVWASPLCEVQSYLPHSARLAAVCHQEDRVSKLA